MDTNDFLIQRISTLTAEEMDLIFHGQFPSELTKEELKQKEDLYSSKIENDLEIDHMKTYSHSEAWN